MRICYAVVEKKKLQVLQLPLVKWNFIECIIIFKAKAGFIFKFQIKPSQAGSLKLKLQLPLVK